MKLIILIQVSLLPFLSFSQLDTAFIAQIKALDTANTLRADTASVPNDLLSEKIRQLRSERKGLTVEAVLRIKIMEEQQKDTVHSKEFYKKLLEELTTGKTAKLIENSLINLYMRIFTEKEVDDLVNFYKTSAGQKMDKEFFLLMLQSFKDAEKLFKLAANNIQLNDN